MLKIEELQKILVPSKKIVIIPHTKPDADAIGSSLALYHILGKLNISAKVISPSIFPNFLNWMKGSKDILIYSPDNSDKLTKIKNHILKADIIFCIDFSSLYRVAELSSFITSSNAKIITIDHHLNPQDFSDILFSDPKASATAILIYKIINQLGLKNLLDKHILELLYAGIITDTGNFQNSNTNSESLSITSKLVDSGIDFTKINDQIYKSNSINKIKFIGYILSKRLKVIPEYKTAYIWLLRSDWEDFNLKTGDTEGLVNFPLSIKNIDFAALIAEQTDIIKISLRSRKHLAINDIAEKYFNGGGHANASGGRSKLTLEETLNKFENIVRTNEKFKLV